MSMIRRSAFIFPLVIALAGCHRGTDEKTTAHADGRPGSDTVVAEVDGTKITLGELDKAVSDDMAEVRQQEFEVRRRGVDRLIEDKLIDKEASRRGMTREALIKAEVDDKAVMPAAGELGELYEMHKARFVGKSREEAIEVIRTSLARQAKAQREQEFRKSLRDGRAVKVTLDAPRTQIPIPADAPFRGPKDAKVTMVEFLDYGCGFCKRAHATVEEILKKYDGKVRFVHRDYPLNPNGPTVEAAKAVKCAGEQSKLWEYHADLLVNPGMFDNQDLTRRATTLGLDAPRFSSCLASDKYVESIRQSGDDGMKAGVRSTPSFFINGRKVTGAQPIEAFVEVIDQELQAAGS